VTATWQIPLVVVFGLVTVLLVRDRDVRIWEAVVIALFGYYLAASPLSDSIASTVQWALRGFLHT
jgi:intracellular septation protein A